MSEPGPQARSISPGASVGSATSASTSGTSRSSYSSHGISRGSSSRGSGSGSMTSAPFGTNTLHGRRSAFSGDSAGGSGGGGGQSAHQRVAAVTVVMLAAVALTSMATAPSGAGSGPALPPLRSGTETRYTEIIGRTPLSELRRTADGEVDYGECEVRPAVAPTHPVTSTFTASYPGSGAKMTWNLIEAITGLVTGDDFQLNGHSNMVSIKTHYPSHEGREVPGAESIPRAILLLRHPLNAIPSYYNYLYEMENHLENHSTRAPLEAWIAWRDANFDRQLQVWKKHTEYWMDHYSPVNRLVVSYEKMTSDEKGSTEALRVAEFLSRSEGVTTRPPEEIPCIWFKVVQYKKAKAKEAEAAQAAAAAAPERQQPPQGQEAQEGRRLQEAPPQPPALPAPQAQLTQPQPEGQQPPPPQDPSAAAVGPGAGAPPPCAGCSESDPNKPKSLRAGPKYVAPYAEKQLRDMIQALSALLERYRDERALAPVLVGYIDEVEKRVRGETPQGPIEGQARAPPQVGPPQEQAPPPPKEGQAPPQQAQQPPPPQPEQPQAPPQPGQQPQPAVEVKQRLR